MKEDERPSAEQQAPLNQREMARITNAREHEEEFAEKAEKKKLARKEEAKDKDVNDLLENNPENKLQPIIKDRVLIVCGVTGKDIGWLDAADVTDVLESDKRYAIMDNTDEEDAELRLLYNPAFDSEEVIEIRVKTAAEWYQHIDRHVEDDMIPADDPKKRLRGVSFVHNGNKMVVVVGIKDFTDTRSYASSEPYRHAIQMRESGTDFTQGVINFFRLKHGLDEITHAGLVFGDHSDLETGDKEEDIIREPSFKRLLMTTMSEADAELPAHEALAILKEMVDGIQTMIGNSAEVTIFSDDAPSEEYEDYLCYGVATDKATLMTVLLHPSGFPVEIWPLGNADKPLFAEDSKKLKEQLLQLAQATDFAECIRLQLINAKEE